MDINNPGDKELRILIKKIDWLETLMAQLVSRVLVLEEKNISNDDAMRNLERKISSKSVEVKADSTTTENVMVEEEVKPKTRKRKTTKTKETKEDNL